MQTSEPLHLYPDPKLFKWSTCTTYNIMEQSLFRFCRSVNFIHKLQTRHLRWIPSLIKKVITSSGDAAQILFWLIVQDRHSHDSMLLNAKLHFKRLHKSLLEYISPFSVTKGICVCACINKSNATWSWGRVVQNNTQRIERRLHVLHWLGS